MYISPVWQDKQGPPFEAALGQANHFSCRLSKYLAAAAVSQSTANPNAPENARTSAMRVNMYLFYHAVTPGHRSAQLARDGCLLARPVIAEHTAEGWQFWERDNYEVRWHVLKSTADLVNKATKLNEKAK
jgi:hypothetical protein